MKTKLKNQKSELQSRPEQLSTSTGNRAKIDYQKRRVNRSLETEKVLGLLRSEAPSFFDIAEVVGKWVWIQFSDKQPPTVTRVLAELGFHWNNTRQTWQHPCGSAKQIGKVEKEAFLKTLDSLNLSTKQGRYIFALRAAKGYCPWYVGKATKSMRQECMYQRCSSFRAR